MTLWKKPKFLVIVILVICLSTNGLLKGAPKGHPKINKTKSVEKALIRMLIERYQRFGVVGRPVNESKVVLNVQYGLQIIQILDLDENKQILRTNCWSMYRWNDSLLQWNQSEHGNITELRIFPDQVWTPDIQLYNFADERIREHRIARIVLHSDGSILWVPQALFKSTCQVSISRFPFDTQVCSLKFGSWTYDRTQLDLSWWVPVDDPVPMPYLDFNDYVPSNEWRTDGETEAHLCHTNRTLQIKSVKKIHIRNQTINNVVTSKEYTVLVYKIRLRRNPSFYVFILVIPCLLLSSLTVIVFWLPPESPAKMMLGMNIFVAFFLLLLLLADLTPNSVKEFPLIGAYFCLNMIMITLSTFLATLVIHLYYRGDRNGPLPAILHRIIIEGMGRLMLVRQSIPLPEEKKTLSHVVVTRSAIGRIRHKLRIPELASNKFMGEDDFEGPQQQQQQQQLQRPAFGLISSCMNGRIGGTGGVCMGKMSGDGGILTAPGCIAAHVCPCNVHGCPKSAEPVGFMSCGQTYQRGFCSYPPKQPTPQAVSTPGALDWHASTMDPLRGPKPAQAVDSEDSPIMLSSSTSLERDVRELKRYVRMFVNRQKESARKNAIAMEWRTMALVLDRLFFFLYITTIGIAIVTSIPGEMDEEVYG